MKSSSFEERISIYCPNPPRCRPAPPLSGLSSRRVIRTGATASVGSTCEPQTPDGNAVAESPSRPGRAPVPPENTSSNANSSSPVTPLQAHGAEAGRTCRKRLRQEPCWAELAQDNHRPNRASSAPAYGAWPPALGAERSGCNLLDR